MAEFSEEDKKKDFEGRKQRALAQMDAILKAEEVGIRLVLGGIPEMIRPMIHYVDNKNYDANRAERRAKVSKKRRNR